jgi:predicted amidohydrolase YtcJ
MPSDAAHFPDPSDPDRSSLTIRNGCVGGRIVDLRCDGGRIIGIEPAGNLEPDGGTSIDARGGFVLPGFVDAHVHLVMAGITSSQIDLARCPDRATFEARIEQGLKTLQDGEWLIGHGWLETDWGGEIPDATWLAVAGDRPAVCIKHDHHACLVNPAALAIALDRFGDRTCPPGGEIVRDAQGQPTGLMLESAAWMIVNPVVPQPTLESRRSTTTEAARHLASLGFTAVGSMEYAEEMVDVLHPVRDELAVRVMVTMLDRALPIDEPLSRLERLSVHSHLELLGCKAFLDGTYGSRTAAMLADFSDTPGNAGMLVELAERNELLEWIEFVVRRGHSPSMHAIGDRAARLALDACDHAEQITLDTGIARPMLRVEHCQAVDASDIPRFGVSTKRIASMQPIHMLDDGPTVEKALGAERLDSFFPTRAIAEAGGRLAFGSDWPIADPCPMEGIRIAVTGRDRSGRVVPGDRTITAAQAAHAYTVEARLALGLPPVSTAIGDPADLVILDLDPSVVDWATETPTVLATVCNGKTTFLS